MSPLVVIVTQLLIPLFYTISMSCPFPGDDQAAVRVTNLSEDANENDLRDLFGPFGPIQRVFLAKDKKTQHSKVYELMIK